MQKFFWGALAICAVSAGPALSDPKDTGSVQNRVSAADPSQVDIATDIANHAQILCGQGQIEQAEAAFKKALDVWSRKPPKTMLAKANCLNNLGLLYFSTSRAPLAINTYKDALAIEESEALTKERPPQLSSIHAITLDNLGQAYRMTDQLDKAEPCYKRALEIEEKTLKPEDPDMAITRCNLACLYLKQKKYKPAEELFLKSLPVLKKALGADSPDYKQVASYYAGLLRDTGRKPTAYGYQ